MEEFSALDFRFPLFLEFETDLMEEPEGELGPLKLIHSLLST